MWYPKICLKICVFGTLLTSVSCDSNCLSESQDTLKNYAIKHFDVDIWTFLLWNVMKNSYNLHKLHKYVFWSIIAVISECLSTHTHPYEWRDVCCNYINRQSPFSMGEATGVNCVWVNKWTFKSRPLSCPWVVNICVFEERRQCWLMCPWCNGVL